MSLSRAGSSALEQQHEADDKEEDDNHYAEEECGQHRIDIVGISVVGVLLGLHCMTGTACLASETLLHVLQYHRATCPAQQMEDELHRLNIPEGDESADYERRGQGLQKKRARLRQRIGGGQAV